MSGVWVQLGADISSGVSGEFGYSIATSAAGTTVVVGDPWASFGGPTTYEGLVRVFDWTGTAWVQRGTDISGTALAVQLGWSVSISADGNTIGVGVPYNGTGSTQVYDWTGSAWTQRGTNITGGTRNGWSVSLAATTANTIAIGAPTTSSGKGQLTVYDWTGAAWIQRGVTLVGEANGDQLGYSVSLSADGNVVAAGAPFNDGSGANAGHVRVFGWSGAAWVQRGTDIDGAVAGDQFGNSVSLSADGAVVAIGAPFSAVGAGSVRVLDWTGTVWTSRGTDILGSDTEQVGTAVALSQDGLRVAVCPAGVVNPPTYIYPVRIYRWTSVSWTQLYNEILTEATPRSPYSIALSADGNIVALGIPNIVTPTDSAPGVFRVFAAEVDNTIDSGGSRRPLFWPTSSEKTDALKVPSCECVNTKTRFRSYDELTRFQRAKLAGNCCSTSCLTNIVVSGGAGYTTASTFVVDGGEPYATPLLMKVVTVDASGAILVATPVQAAVRYKTMPVPPYTTTNLTGPTDASGAVISALTWTPCWPCKPYA
jgi:hypothetical protein